MVVVATLLLLVALSFQTEARPYRPHLHALPDPCFNGLFNICVGRSDPGDAKLYPHPNQFFLDSGSRFNRFMNSLFAPGWLDQMYRHAGAIPFYQPNFMPRTEMPSFQSPTNSDGMFRKRLDFFIPDNDNGEGIHFKSNDEDDEERVHVETMSIDELETKPGLLSVYKAKDKDNDADVTVFKYRPEEDDVDGVTQTGFIEKIGPITMTGFKTYKSHSNSESSYRRFTADLEDDDLFTMYKHHAPEEDNRTDEDNDADEDSTDIANAVESPEDTQEDEEENDTSQDAGVDDTEQEANLVEGED